MGSQPATDSTGGQTLSLGEAAAEPRALPEPGDTLNGKYRVTRALGRGGMGVVYEAEHLRHGGRVAIKLLTSEASPVRAARLLREARAVASLCSPHVVRLLDVDATAEGVPFLVLERLEGQTLAELLRGEGPMRPERAVALVRQACEGLSEAHGKGIVHRDLKPSNLFLAREPGAERVKVLDFGVARAPEAASEATLTGDAALLGSLPYASPEQMRSPRDADARADVWSLGVTLFELLTGHLPFSAETSAGLAAAIATDRPPRLRERCPEAPRALEELILECLCKRPAGRPATAAALAARLDALGASRRPWPGLAALVVGLAALWAAAGALASPSAGQPDPAQPPAAAAAVTAATGEASSEAPPSSAAPERPGEAAPSHAPPRPNAPPPPRAAERPAAKPTPPRASSPDDISRWLRK